MTKVRLDPLGLLSAKPQAVVAAPRKAEVARMTNIEEGECASWPCTGIVLT